MSTFGTKGNINNLEVSDFAKDAIVIDNIDPTINDNNTSIPTTKAVIDYATGGGGSTPGGDNTQVQFNDGGNFGGDSTFTFIKGSNTLSVNNISGTLTGNVTGNVNGNVTGNADTATILETPRAIGGVDFDGSAPITLPGVNANQINAALTWAGNAASATTATTATTATSADTLTTPRELQIWCIKVIQQASTRTPTL